MKTKPYPHQQECFDRFKDAGYFAIFADMGTGKSKMVIDIVDYKYSKRLHDRWVIIAPVAVGPQWLKEQLPTHCDSPYQAYLYRSGNLKRLQIAQSKFLADCRMNDDLQILIINFEAFVKDKGNALVNKFIKTSNKPPMFTIDEASRIKNPDAKSVKNIIKLRQYYPESMRSVLTGTPAAKSPVDMWSIFNFLQGNYMGCSHMAFKHYHEVQFDRTLEIKDKLMTIRTPLDATAHLKIRKWINNNAKTPENAHKIRRRYGLTQEDYDLIAHSDSFVRFKNVDKLQAKIAPDTFSVSKKDCLELPDKVYQVVDLKMNDEQKKQIKQLAKYSATVYAGETLTISTKALLGLRVLQICGGNLAVHTEEDGVYDTVPIKGTNAKLNYILSDLEEAGGQQCIVWAVFKAEIEMLHFELGKKYMVGAMHGDTPEAKRIENIERFKAGELQVLVSHPQVGGYGLNLQNAELQYWYSRDFRTEARLQAEDRSHRIGTVRSPVYKDLVYNSVFEKRVMNSLKEEADMNSQFVSMGFMELFGTE